MSSGLLVLSCIVAMGTGAESPTVNWQSVLEREPKSVTFGEDVLKLANDQKVEPFSAQAYFYKLSLVQRFIGNTFNFVVGSGPDIANSTPFEIDRLLAAIPVWRPNHQSANNAELAGWRLPSVGQFKRPLLRATGDYAAAPRFFDADVGPKLSFGGIPRNPVGLKSQAERDQHQDGAYGGSPGPPRCPAGRVSGCIRRFPLGAQIAVSLFIAGVALGLVFRAMRPFGSLVITRRDVCSSVGLGLSGVGLLGLSGWVWMLGG